MFVLTDRAGTHCLPRWAQLRAGRLQAEPVGSPLPAVLPVRGSCPQRLESGSGAGHRLSGVMSPQRDKELDHHGHPLLK